MKKLPKGMEGTLLGKILSELTMFETPGCEATDDPLRDGDTVIGSITDNPSAQKLWAFMWGALEDAKAKKAALRLKEVTAINAKHLSTPLPEVMQTTNKERLKYYKAKEEANIAANLFWGTIHEIYGEECLNEDGNIRLAIREGWQIVRLAKNENEHIKCDDPNCTVCGDDSSPDDMPEGLKEMLRGMGGGKIISADHLNLGGVVGLLDAFRKKVE